MGLLENVRISDYKEQLNNLRKDDARPKFATNLVYLTNSYSSKKVEKNRTKPKCFLTSNFN